MCKSRPDINLKDAIGEHQFAVVPRSMFAADGYMVHCSMKSSLLGILEKLPDTAINSDEMNISTDVVELPAAELPSENILTKNVVLVDAMADVQSMGKPETIKNCSELADHFINHMVRKYRTYDEIRLLFDGYDVPSSLKMATRDTRQWCFTTFLIQQILRNSH